MNKRFNLNLTRTNINFADSILSTMSESEKYLKQLIGEATYHTIYVAECEIRYGQVDGRFHGLELVKRNGLVVSVAVYENGYCIFNPGADKNRPGYEWLVDYKI